MVCNGFTKLSFLVFYFQLSPQAKFQAAVMIVVGIISSYSQVISALLLSSCKPV